MAKIAASHGVKDWYAHNGGKFDASFLLEAIQFLNWKATAHFAAGRIVILQVSADNGMTLRLYDSMAIVPTALKRAAEDFQLESRKLFSDDDYSKDVRTWERIRLENGCRADCEIVLELLEKVESQLELEGGALKATFSSCALSVVQAQCGILDTRKWTRENTIARQAYCGGRVEIFRHMPQGLIDEYDINSSYPHSMTTALPWELVSTAWGAAEVAKIWQEEYDGVIEATVKVRKNTYIPALPFINDGVFFPIGEWRAFFTKRELVYAHDLGQLEKLKVHSAVIYRARKPFETFVSAFYRLKSEAQGGARAFYKLVLNGAYGKFGQKPERENVIIFGSDDDALAYLDKAASDTTRVLSRNTMRFIAKSEFRWPKQTHYALAAAITAESRISLHRYLCAARNLSYCDTDSIHGKGDFSTSNVLGGLKLELKDIEARYYAPKMYELHPKEGEAHYASKGFHVDAETFALAISGRQVKRENFRLLKSQLRDDNHPRRVSQARAWSGLSMKRRALYDTIDGETVPWTVDDLRNEKHRENVSPTARWLK